MLKASFAQHPYSKKKEIFLKNFKVKTVQVEDEIIDISGWSISLCYCHLVGGSGVRPPAV